MNTVSSARFTKCDYCGNKKAVEYVTDLGGKEFFCPTCDAASNVIMLGGIEDLALKMAEDCEKSKK